MDSKILQIHSFRIIIGFRFSHSAVSVIPALIPDWENQASIIDVIVFSYLILFASIFKSKIYLLPYSISILHKIHTSLLQIAKNYLHITWVVT